MKKWFILVCFIFSLSSFSEEVTGYLPHIAETDTWETWLVADNAGFETHTLQLQLFDETGTIIDTRPIDVEPGDSYSELLTQGSCAVLSYDNVNLTTRVSYVNKSQYGIAEFRLIEYEDTELEFLMPRYLSDSLTWSGLAFMNVSSEDAHIVLTATDKNGDILSLYECELVGTMKIADTLASFFPGISRSDISKVSLTSDQSVAGITISGNELSSLLFTTAVRKQSTSETLVIPHIAEGGDYWDNFLILDNQSDTSKDLMLTLYSEGATALQQSVELPPLSSIEVNLSEFLYLNADSGLLTGDLDYVCARVGYVYKSTGGTAEFILDSYSSEELTFTFPGYAEDRVNWNGIALFNNSDDTSFVLLKAYVGDDEIDRQLIHISSRSKFVGLLSDVFVLNDGVTPDRVVAVSDGQISGVNISGSDLNRFLFTRPSVFNDNRTFEEKLASVPGIQVTELGTLQPFSNTYRIDVTQRLDHSNPQSDTFIQTIYLSHRDVNTPVVLYTGGYYLGTNTITELTDILQGNQIKYGHRFFKGAEVDNEDWQFMNIQQAAGDAHRLVMLFRDIYRGHWVNTGGSKGGMTSIFHRRFYPEDVTVSVPYVAPILFGLPDDRFEYFIENTAGTEDCRQLLRDTQRRMLEKRQEIVDELTYYASLYGRTYDRLGFDKALEYMVMEYPVSHWQYGANECDSVPAADATAKELTLHLLDHVGFLYSDQDYEYYNPFYYQAVTEFGYYSFMTDYFNDLLVAVPEPSWQTFGPDNAEMEYNPDVMQDVITWIQQNGNNILFIYGGNDPWTSCAVELTGETNAVKITEPGANHGVRIRQLTE